MFWCYPYAKEKNVTLKKPDPSLPEQGFFKLISETLNFENFDAPSSFASQKLKGFKIFCFCWPVINYGTVQLSFRWSHILTLRDESFEIINFAIPFPLLGCVATSIVNWCICNNLGKWISCIFGKYYLWFYSLVAFLFARDDYCWNINTSVINNALNESHGINSTSHMLLLLLLLLSFWL